MILVGTVLKGYCGGAFGRDSYARKRVEAVGADWLVVRYEDSHRVDIATFDDTAHMVECVERWANEKDGWGE